MRQDIRSKTLVEECPPGRISSRLASLTALLLVFVCGLTSSVSETQANWNDVEHIGGVEVTALEINHPESFRCSESFATRRLQWDHPSDGPPAGGYTLRIFQGDELVYETEPDAGTTDFRLTGGIITLLLRMLFGDRGEFTATLVAHGPPEWQWTSEAVTTGFEIDNALLLVPVVSCQQ